MLQTWFGKIGNDPNSGLYAMDARILVLVSRHCSVMKSQRNWTGASRGFLQRRQNPGRNSSLWRRKRNGERLEKKVGEVKRKGEGERSLIRRGVRTEARNCHLEGGAWLKNKHKFRWCNART